LSVRTFGPGSSVGNDPAHPDTTSAMVMRTTTTTGDRKAAFPTFSGYADCSFGSETSIGCS
jgi:hypothetical protein